MDAKLKTPRRYGIPDEDTPELTEEMLERARPFLEVARERGWPLPGRPRLASPKQAVNIRLDPEIVAHFKAGGRGWQTRINAALKAYVAGEQGRAAAAPGAATRPVRSRKRA
jgi:uncharacterized protein (DUF4415 family)